MSLGPTAPQQRALTLLAFDFGTRRIGVALAVIAPGSVASDAPVRPLLVIAADHKGEPWVSIERLRQSWAPDCWVVGRPTHPDGTPHEMTARAERFARQLQGRFGGPLALVDERYSSPADGTDADAAAIILRQYLNESVRT